MVRVRDVFPTLLSLDIYRPCRLGEAGGESASLAVKTGDVVAEGFLDGHRKGSWCNKEPEGGVNVDPVHQGVSDKVLVVIYLS